MKKQRNNWRRNEHDPERNGAVAVAVDAPAPTALGKTAFIVTFIAALALYIATLAPTVTLEDSGELVVAADYLGVPHPPGYPTWTMLSWVFQTVFGFVLYRGSPNPAWGVAFGSALFGAMASGLVAYLTCLMGTDLLQHTTKRQLTHSNTRVNRTACALSAISAGLLFAFSPVMWSQSVIVEVYALNVFFLMLVLVLLYRWVSSRGGNRTLYAAVFTMALGLTNHHALLFVAPLFPVAIGLKNRALLRDGSAAFLSLLGLFLLIRSSASPPEDPSQFDPRPWLRAGGIACLLSPIVILIPARKLMTEWRRLLCMSAVACLGLAPYAYMPIASSQNPPMNWAYTRTWEGFKHAITRGQYEKIKPIENSRQIAQSPAVFVRRVHAVATNPGNYVSTVAQFTLPVSLAPLLLLLACRRMGRTMRGRFAVLPTGLFFTNILFVVFQAPDLAVHTLFICRVQYIQAHAIYAVLIGTGFTAGLWALSRLLKEGRVAVLSTAFAILLLAGIPLYRNYTDDELALRVGGAEQNGHDFGWQFGYWQLTGAEGILEELTETERAEYPNPDYPEPVDPNAIVYGGTDPGRFVPTYMIYSARVREDVFLITQNALADHTYMNVMRDLYGDRIWMPSNEDSARAFGIYVTEVQEGRRPNRGVVKTEDGRIQVAGVRAVMDINGILARMIFENNKGEHSFYVEESYPIDWMYPYLEPHGLIMKINKEPLKELDPEVVRNDLEFWDWYSRRLLNDRKFLRDTTARKTFAKLRSAIGRLYQVRGLREEAERALRQAMALSPTSPEAVSILAGFYMQTGRYDDAERIMLAYAEYDPDDKNVKDTLSQVRQMQRMVARAHYLQQKSGSGTTVPEALELAELCLRLNQPQGFDHIMSALVAQHDNMPAELVLRAAVTCARAGRSELAATALTAYLARVPGNPNAWMELSALQAKSGQTAEALESLSAAVRTGGEDMRRRVGKDSRFTPLRGKPEFRDLVSPAARRPVRRGARVYAFDRTALSQ